MNPDELTSSQLDCVFRTMDALHSYIVEMHKSHTLVKGFYILFTGCDAH